MESSATVLSTMRRKKKTYCSNITGSFFFFKRIDRIESSKEREPVPSTSAVSETAVCPA